MKAKLLALITAVSLLTIPQAAFAQETATGTGLDTASILSTLLYGAIGLGLYVVGYIVFDKLFRLDLQRELVEDQNVAIGIMMAGVFIGIAILIAAVIG